MLRMKSAPGRGVLQYAPTDHGGNIYKIAEETGLPENTLIDFSASINPLGVSKKVKGLIRKELDNLNNYPDSAAKELREKLARRHDIDPDMIICGNGSTELIYLIPRALNPLRVLIPVPTFSEYERACKTRDKLQVKSYTLKKEYDFKIYPDEFISAMEKIQNSKVRARSPRPYPALNSAMPSGMAFLCNPNNPTGHLLKRDEVLGIADAAGEAGCFLVVDEAFIDFCPSESVIDAVCDNPYLIVLRSMTKFYALTGLRIGYGVFHPDIVSRIREFKEPWTVNYLAQKAAVTALEDEEYAKQTYKLIENEKSFLEEGFEKSGIRFFPSDVNYYLLNVEARHAVPLLRQKGILVRDCSNFQGLGASYIRVAVKSRKHNRRLIEELRTCLKVGACNTPLQIPEQNNNDRMK